MSDIQPIPTTYAGTRFRSRLEARWAAYFDRRGLRWEYEPVLFKQRLGRRDYPFYRPDFWVDYSWWIEIKPCRCLTREECLKIKYLQDRGEKVAAFLGSPSGPLCIVPWKPEFIPGFNIARKALKPMIQSVRALHHAGARIADGRATRGLES